MRKIFPRDFNTLVLKLASPEKIKEWSYGEVTKAETINYRTGRMERNGLFDERIFGPAKDFECYCGKYRRIRYKDIVCEKCGVEVTRSIVRRERMGHIELASPVSHIWFLRGIPSRVGLILDLSLADVEKVVYFAGYIITEVNEEERGRLLKDLESEHKTKAKSLSDKEELKKLKDKVQVARLEIEGIVVGTVLDEVRFNKYSLKYGSIFSAEIGAEAIYNIFKKMDMKKEIEKLETALETGGAADRGKLNKRLGLLKPMLKSGIRPEWLFLTSIPVMPPGLRPMVALDGGRHATSDVNDLYRRVINRNNRLKKLKEVSAPDVILRNEKRILQEAVDALIDNAMRRGPSQASFPSKKRELKSLAENLKGKQGLFRQNLLGKRVDYSGRSVIVVGPNLRLNQCGLPKYMALELFRPFVISKILQAELAFNIRGAGRLIEEGIPEVWAILEEVIKDKYVLLNRAPTLHRLGVQAFKPILIEGKAIELHPLVCPAFNADFDGDQMAVHVPLGEEAQREAAEIIASDKNILKPGSGDPTISHKMLDILLGCFWITKIIPGEKGEGKYFSSPNIAITAFDFKEVGLRARIKVMATETLKYSRFGGGIFETTVGKLLFNSVLPKDYPYIETEIDRKTMTRLIDDLLETYSFEQIAGVLDKIKDFGFKYATASGITWGLSDTKIPPEKKEIIARSRELMKEAGEQHKDGLLSQTELYRKTIEVWQNAKSEIGKLMPDTLDKNGPVYDMLKSGARGEVGQLTQMAGMKGLITDTVGRTLSFPVISSYKEGLSPIEYFITTHGARYGLAATALQTAKAGYLTRRLVDVAQDCIITEEDCGDKNGKAIVIRNAEGAVNISLAKVVGGRVLAKGIVDHEGNTVFPKGTLLRKKDIPKIEAESIVEVTVRSPLSCKSIRGLCQKCYGLDPGRNKPIALGEAAGIIAAQAIGEPGTQLTMRTFHLGGIAETDITMGLPRVEEVFERRVPKNPALINETSGTVVELKRENREQIIVVAPSLEEKKSSKKEKEFIEYPVPFGRSVIVKVGQVLEKGELLTDGSADPTELFKYAGKEMTEDYIIREITRIYDLQGEAILRKHIEIIVRQMFSRRKVKDPGGTGFTVGDVVDEGHLAEQNAKAKKAKREEAKAEQIILGITEVALNTKSFLSAASFQNTTRILIKAALRGAEDEMRGLKENVIVGRLIPAGTGFRKNTEAGKIENSEEQL